MAHPKHDYNGNEFYEEIFGFAIQGFTDAEIAASLDLSPGVFCTMKNGNYSGWNEEQNQERSARISKVLERARLKVNSILRGVYLKAAVGKIKTKNTTKRYIQKRCVCDGQDEDCLECGGTGYVFSTSKSVIQETDIELPPNIQAISTWLYHHDEDWRRASEGRQEDKTNRIEGININVSYSKAEDLSLQGDVGDEVTENL